MTVVEREGGWDEVWTPGKDDSDDFKFFKFSSCIYKQKNLFRNVRFWCERNSVSFSFVSSKYTRQEYFPIRYVRKERNHIFRDNYVAKKVSVKTLRVNEENSMFKFCLKFLLRQQCIRN